MNTKIKARKIFENRYKWKDCPATWHLSRKNAIKMRGWPHLGMHLVYVLDASRYKEVVEQMAKAWYESLSTKRKLENLNPNIRMLNLVFARAALRSIGITKLK